jgi:DNA-binding GntR family transcriptional regulator
VVVAVNQDEPAVSKSQWAYRTVRSMILSGELEPGASLDQQALAARLGVSTTPLREALRRLEAENYVISRDHREMLIAPISLADVEQIYQVRLELDPLAARLACERMSQAQIVALQRGIPAVGSRRGDASESRDFHRAIYVASGNQALIRVMEALYDQFERFRVRLRPDPGASRRSREDHVRMCELLLARDADGLGKLMQEHLLASLEHCRRDIATTNAPAATGAVSAETGAGPVAAAVKKPARKTKTRL